MFCRGYRNEDYKKLKKFWEEHNWDAVPEALLPITGIVCVDNNDNVLLGAVWIYAIDAVPVGWMEWLVTNPNNTPRESLKVINELLEQVLVLSEMLDLKFLMTSVNKKSLVKLYGKHNFEPTDQDVTNMMRVL